jgi:small subunit ribosomal protein S18
VAFKDKKKKKFRRFGERQKALTRLCTAKELFDYKNIPLLQRVTTQQGKLYSRKRAANTAAAQRHLKKHVKYARFLALLPYVG